MNYPYSWCNVNNLEILTRIIHSFQNKSINIIINYYYNRNVVGPPIAKLLLINFNKYFISSFDFSFFFLIVSDLRCLWEATLTDVKEKKKKKKKHQQNNKKQTKTENKNAKNNNINSKLIIMINNASWKNINKINPAFNTACL